MKTKTFIILLFSLISGNITAQNCCNPEVLLDEYERDVKHLALLRMESINAPEQNLIEIDQLYQDTIWDALSAIFHSTSDGRDVVFDQFCIHHDIWTTSDFLRISNNLYVRLDTITPWYQNWADGNITTNNLIIDSLTQKYGFNQVTFPFPFINVFKLTTDQLLNLNAFADSIEMNDNIIYAEKVTFAGGATRIAHQKINELSFFDFIVGWGDCPSGCTNWHTWSFVVDEECNVEYLGSSGDSNLPEPLNCNLTSSLPEVELILPIDTFCVQETIVEITGGFPLGGEYSGLGITNNILNPSEAGLGNHLITYTFEGVGGCIYSASQEIIINEENCTTETNNVESLKSIKIFPNPSNGKIFIQAENLNTHLLIELFDLQGKLIFKSTSNSSLIEIGNLNKGIFFIKLIGNNIIETRKVVVN